MGFIVKFLRRLVCRHRYSWSERRQAEVCCLCGHEHRVRGVRC